MLRGAVLEFLAPTGTAHALLALEPSFLARVARGQQSDASLRACWTAARGDDARFCVSDAHGFELLYRRRDLADADSL